MPTVDKISIALPPEMVAQVREAGRCHRRICLVE